MALYYNRRIKKFLDAWPGKQRFGLYRFLPLFFCVGALLEFSMINWQVGQTNFYKTFKEKNVLLLAQNKYDYEQLLKDIEEKKIPYLSKSSASS